MLPVRFFLRPTLRSERAFLSKVSADTVELHTTRRIEPGSVLFLDLRTINPRLTRTPLAWVVVAVQQRPGRWLIRCRTNCRFSEGELQLPRAA